MLAGGVEGGSWLRGDLERTWGFGGGWELKPREMWSTGNPGGAGRTWTCHPTGLGFTPTFTSIFAELII